MTHHVSLVPAEAVNQILPEVASLLKDVEPYTGGRFIADDMIAMCTDDRAFMLVAFDQEGVINGVVICQFVPYPRKKMVSILFLGGRKGTLAYWKDDMHALIKKIGMDAGYEGDELCGREAWCKLFPEYRVTLRFMERSYGAS